MNAERLLGADHTYIDEISTVGVGPAALAISRGGAKKTYAHKDPNEDVTAYIVTEWALLALVADGHGGHRAAAAAVDRILAEHAPQWIGEKADLQAQFAGSALEMLVDLNSSLVASEPPTSPEPSRTTLSLALVRPGEGIAAGLSIGDSHIFRVGSAGAREWLPLLGPQTTYLGTPSLDRQRIADATRFEVCALGSAHGLVLATDGLSERGIGVKNPAHAVGRAYERALAGDPERVPIDTARGIVELALAAQRLNRAGDNMASAVIWWGQ